MQLILATLLLPIVAIAQGTFQQGSQGTAQPGGIPIGNPAGVILGIFAMCGTSPVDCGDGWCCLSGQVCTPGQPHPMCNDPSLVSSSGKTGAVVNAAYFGKETSNQLSPNGNGTVAPKSSTPLTGAAADMSAPRGLAMVGALLGTCSLVFSLL